MTRKRNFLRNRRGQGLTEYALLICLVSLGLILLLGRYRNALGNTFRNARTAADGASSIAQVPATTGGTGGNTGNNTTNNTTNNNNNNNSTNGFFLNTSNGNFITTNNGSFIFTGF
jgi:Flp pilus assembly pilin Flp